ncbi:acetolactate synthase large subunit, partial [Bacillus sp. SIMBA_008]
EAFYIAESGRPGPVLIDIPKDVQNENVTSFYNEVIEIPGYKLEPMPDGRKLREVAKAISEAKRPLLYIGGGVIHSGGSDELIKFA